LIKALALILGLVSVGWAQPQPNLAPVAYRDFSGGYVDNVDPSQLKPSESPDMVNVVVDDPVGSLKPRKGFALCGNLPSGNIPTNIYEYSRSDGTRRLIATDNSTVYSTPDCQAWTTIVSGMSSSAQVYFATVRDKLWIVNGSTWPATWDGTSYTLLDGRTNTPNPAPPKCSFIEFWKERVWCGAPSGDPSGVAFSALTSADSNAADLDPSTGTLSWPASNVFEIDQNAGSRVYGVKAYRNRLYAFKDNGVWEIGFESEFNNFVRKTYASVGSRYQTSITEADGILYFTGRDGIYAFDGDNALRISAKIDNKFKALNQPLISQNYKTWTSKTDYDQGSYSSATANDIAGAITISSQPASFTNGRFETGLLFPMYGVETTTSPSGTGYAGIISAASNPKAEGSVIEGSYSAQALAYCAGDGPQTAALYIYNTAGTTVTTVSSFSSSLSTVTVDLTAFAGQTLTLHFYANIFADTGYASSAHLYSSTFTAHGILSFQAATRGCGTYTGFTALDNFQQFVYFSSGVWKSEIYNAVAVSTWGAFTATDISNGGSIAYGIRYGATSNLLQASSFQPITPGSIIPASITQTFIQLIATMTANTDLVHSPQVGPLQIAWNSGGNNTQKIYAGEWQNTLWVSASSGTATTNNIVLRRAKTPLDAWMPMGMQIGPMARFNDSFYGGASTHSAIYRLDYGTNDDGAAISWSWASKDENWGLPNNAKYLQEMDADYRNNAACNIRMGYVQDQNTTYCVGTAPSPNAILASGTGSRRLNFNGGPAYTYRFKICDDQKDQVPTIIGVTGHARVINRRGD
jgi:hypothetical protein